MPEPLAAFGELNDGDRELVARHQRAVRDLPDLSVADLVHDYRTQFREDPLVARDETAYYLSVRPHVWAEFGDWLDASDAELARLRELHAEQFEAAVGEPADREAMVLTRE